MKEITEENQQQQQSEVFIVSNEPTETSENVPKSFIKRVFHRLQEHSGIWYMLAGNLVFACCTFALKFIPADMFDIMIMRFSIQSTVFGAYAAFYKKYNIFSSNGQPLACALNIFMSSGTNLTYLAAFYFLPLSDVNAIKYTYVVWAAILSVIFFKDRFKVVNGMALIFTVSGLLLATKPQALIKMLNQAFSQSTFSNDSINATITETSSTITTSPYYYLGILLAFISSFTKATQMIARKQLIKTKQPHSIMNFQFTAFAFVVALVYSVIRRFWQTDPYPWKWMLTAGVAISFFHLISNTCYAKALKRENLQILTIIGTLDIIHACILQYIFLRLTRPILFYIGATFIVISAVILSIDTYLTVKK